MNNKIIVDKFALLLTTYYMIQVTLQSNWMRYGRHTSGRETDFSNYKDQILSNAPKYCQNSIKMAVNSYCHFHI